MFRSFVVLAAVACALACTTANAQWRGRRGYSASAHHGHSRNAGGHRSYYPSSSFGVGIGSYGGYGYGGYGYGGYGYGGYGYGGFGFFDPLWYDPYRYGSFKAPDLLDDPLFIETHRYDSHFPGRRRAPLVFRSAVPAPARQTYRNPTTQAGAVATQSVPINRADLSGQLQSASLQLSRSLSVRPDSDAWMEYLAPDRINQLIASGSSSQLRELLTHYDGVVGNPQLRSIAAASGFATTRSLLRQYVSHMVEPVVDPTGSDE